LNQKDSRTVFTVRPFGDRIFTRSLSTPSRPPNTEILSTFLATRNTAKVRRCRAALDVIGQHIVDDMREFRLAYPSGTASLRTFVFAARRAVATP